MHEAGNIDLYYTSPAGRRAADILATALAHEVRLSRTARLLGLGHVAPLLTGLDPGRVERLALIQPSGKAWPPGDGCCVALAEALPFADALFDQALLVHALEHAPRPQKLLRELWRVLAPGGEIILVVPNRAGLWVHFERTPWGDGRPWGLSQLDRLLTDAMFERRSHRTLFAAPPLAGLGWLNGAMLRALPGMGGLHLLRAVKTDGFNPAMVGRSGKMRLAQA